jgi:hypothetical protein
MPRVIQLCLALLVFTLAASILSARVPGQDIQVSVADSSNQPIPGVRIEVKLAGQSVATAVTDQTGQAAFPGLAPAAYEITAVKEGFETARGKSDSAQPVRITLDPAAQHDSVQVSAATTPADQTGATSVELTPQQVKNLPSRPATVSDALPMVPGVIRKPDGGIEINGSPEHRSALIVNSADVTDPATGQFGLTVPIDSVQTLTVFQTPFLAEYGRFTAGLVSVETRRGGDEWKWEINDPFPDFAIRSYHLRGLRDATPRLNAEGPLIRNKLFFSEGLEYEVRKVQVHTLPFPDDQKKNEGVNSFFQVDWIKSEKQLVTATIHIAPQKIDYADLDYFNPEPTTPDAATHNYTATLGDKWNIFGGLLDNTISATRFTANVWGQGPEDLVMTPTGNSGNYFEQQNRYSTRVGWSPTFAFKPVNKWGLHEFKVGTYIAESTLHGQVFEHPIDILDAMGVMTEQITFFGGREFQMNDTEYAIFGQDHWTVTKHLTIDLGVRTESQEVSESFRVAPRGGFVWNALPRLGTTVSGGFGMFYDRVPLNIYAFNHYPKESIDFYDTAGDVTAGPFIYANTLGVADVHSDLIFHHAVAGDFSPQSATGSLQVEQPITSALHLRVSYMQSQSQGLVTMNPIAPDPVSNIGAYELLGDGTSRYHQLEATARIKAGSSGQLFVSYVHSRDRGDLNDFNTYLGSFPIPLVRPDEFGNLPGDVPNRFLAWGSFQLPDGFRVSPVLEYRTGFPYATFDAEQNYAGPPNVNRYPGFFSLDSRVSKDIKVNPKYTVRLSVSDFNLTNHFNPEAIHANIADPAYGLFFGQRSRRFTADFDVLF